VAAALQIWSATFSKAFDSLPAAVRDAVQRKWTTWVHDWETSRTSDFKTDLNPNCELAITASFMNSTSSKAAFICTTPAIDVRFTSGRISLSDFRNPQ